VIASVLGQFAAEREGALVYAHLPAVAGAERDGRVVGREPHTRGPASADLRRVHSYPKHNIDSASTS